MPELPEVETIVRQLKESILGKKIIKVNILDQKVVDKRIKNVVPCKIVDVKRRGKFILIKLNKVSLLVHLRMTGYFNYSKNIDKQYLAGSFFLDSGEILTYHSIRRFGHIKLLEDRIAFEEKLGLEPLESSEEEMAKELMKYPKSNLKNKLLDQKCIVGIGNIYAQEALYHSRINPCKKIKDISKTQLIKLAEELKKVLNLAIKNNGTTVQNYNNIDGKGNFQNLLVVYKKEKCPLSHNLTKVKLGGRGTTYCKICQK